MLTPDQELFVSPDPGHIFTGEEHRNVLSVKNHKKRNETAGYGDVVLLRLTLHLQNMAAMLEKLVQYPAGSLYEIEFFSEKSTDP